MALSVKMTAAEKTHHRAGLALVAMAAISWSSGGVFIRIITADLMTLLFWRGMFSGTALVMLVLLMERGRTPAILARLRWPALAVMLLSANAMISGIGAMRFAGVAETMVIYATVPFVTAGLAYLFIGERPAVATMVASVIALLGVAVMLIGTPLGGSGIGKLLAASMALSMAGFTVILRHHRDVPMLPAMGASAWLCAFFTFWFAAPLSVSASDLGLLALFGVFQNAGGLAFYVFGSKRVPAAEATLIAALEVPLTPFWVWLLMAEIPPTATIVGGAVVMLALFGHIVLELRAGFKRDAPARVSA